VIGSFLLGAVLTGLADNPLEVQIGALLAIGFLGDFTTFSTYAYETVMLVRERRWTPALLYQLGGVALAVLAVLAGMTCGTLIGSASGQSADPKPASYRSEAARQTIRLNHIIESSAEANMNSPAKPAKKAVISVSSVSITSSVLSDL
jgi:hypothetical protein